MTIVTLEAKPKLLHFNRTSFQVLSNRVVELVFYFSYQMFWESTQNSTCYVHNKQFTINIENSTILLFKIKNIYID